VRHGFILDLAARISTRRGAAPPTLTNALALGERGVPLVTLAPALVATELAVRNATVAMAHDVRQGQLVSALAEIHVRGHQCASDTDDAQVIEVDAAAPLTRVLQPSRRGQRTAARLVQPAAGCTQGAPSDPEAAAIWVTFDRLIAMGQHPESHVPMVCSRQPYAGYLHHDNQQEVRDGLCMWELLWRLLLERDNQADAAEAQVAVAERRLGRGVASLG
jgi:hypothetical protein